VTESVVTTRGPNGLWNVAALGLHADDGESDDRGTGAVARDRDATGGPARARTWGRTRTRRNFDERGVGYVQFTRDPVDFTEAALAVREEPEPVLGSADAWVRVRAERAGEGRDGGTEWVDWRLHAEESAIERETVPTTNRGYGAVVEATVAASRLGVDAYDTAVLRDRLDYFTGVIERCGGPRERAALSRLRELADW
jgi:hypothetical protein